MNDKWMEFNDYQTSVSLPFFTCNSQKSPPSRVLMALSHFLLSIVLISVIGMR